MLSYILHVFNLLGFLILLVMPGKSPKRRRDRR